MYNVEQGGGIGARGAYYGGSGGTVEARGAVWKQGGGSVEAEAGEHSVEARGG